MFNNVVAVLALICVFGSTLAQAQIYRVPEKRLRTVAATDSTTDEKDFSRWEGSFGPVMTLSNIVDEEKTLLAKTGYGLNFSLFYYPISRLSFGIDASYITTSLKTNWVEDMRQTRIFAGGKIILTPGTTPRLYIPYGVGWVRSETKISKRDLFKANTSAAYLGLGVEYNFFSHLVAAIDYRLFYLTDPDFTPNISQSKSIRHDFMVKLVWQL